MILPSRLPRRKSSTPSPQADGAGTTIPATEDMALPGAEFSNDVQLNAKDTEAALDEMELQYPTSEVEDRPPIYVFTGHGWREPTRAEALAMTIPFQDPEDPPRVQFGMGLRDCNGQISPYVRTENDDVCVAPSELMQVDGGALGEEAGHLCVHPTATTTKPLEIPKTPVKRKSTSTKRAKSPPPPLPSTPSRKRKATSSPSKTRERRKSVNIASTSNLSSIAESPDEPQPSTSTSHTINSHTYLMDSDDDGDDQATLVGSPYKRPLHSRSPPRKMRPPTSSSTSSPSTRPPHSSGKASSPLKPKAATTFAGYQCQMPGCTFTASSPQHIKHHYESFQHGRVTRGASRWEG